MRRSASTPTLSGADEGLEVYVATRPLACKLPHVPAALQNGLLRDIGCERRIGTCSGDCCGWTLCRVVQRFLLFLPRSEAEAARSCAGAHYYTVIRHPRDGSLTSLDFGPVGGRDIAFTPARESLWQWGRKRLARGALPVPGTPGEVREMLVRHLMRYSAHRGCSNLDVMVPCSIFDCVVEYSASSVA